MTVRELIEVLTRIVARGGGDLPVLVHPEGGEADEVEQDVNHAILDWMHEAVWLMRARRATYASTTLAMHYSSEQPAIVQAPGTAVDILNVTK
jgi:hypothetical protein